MLPAGGSLGSSTANSSNVPTLLTLNGIIQNQQINGQQPNRGTPILTPAYFPNTAFAPFSFSHPGSVVPCITSSPTGTIFQSPGGHFPFNVGGSMFVAQPQTLMNGSPMGYSTFSQSVSGTNANHSTGTTVLFTAPITSDICISSGGSMPVIQNGIVSIAPSVMQSSAPNVTSTVTVTESVPPIKCKQEVKPVLPLGTVVNPNQNAEANSVALEKINFHRDLILEAIDKLRDRKARPDLERISCLLRRQHNIPPSDTQYCLNRLADSGAILLVDYKGNMSYRNPTKWRKTATMAGSLTNRPNLSRLLIDALKSLITEGGDTNQGFTVFQIEQAIKNLKPAPADRESENATSSSSAPSSPLPELTGSTLRQCLDREASYGKLAKLLDGRYVLDECGEKKRSTLYQHPFGRRPVLGKPPSSAPNLGLTGGSFGKPLIAPANDSAVGKPLGVLSIAPGRPLARRPPFSTGKRGRPPSIKSKKMLTSCSQQPILPAPSDGTGNLIDKRIKLETVSGPQANGTTTTFMPLEGTMMVSATPMQTISLAPAPPPPLHTNSGTPSGHPTAMMMYPSLYNPTAVFAVAPEATTIVAATNFQPDPNNSNSANAPHTAVNSSAASDSTNPVTTASVVASPMENIRTTTSATASIAAAAQASNPGGETKAETSSNVCCRCQEKAKEDEFLTCTDCGLRAHPSCLDFCPEVTARARHSSWQCANCKCCCICKQKKSNEGGILICDACDKGYHGACHAPAVAELCVADQTAPWICADCRALGYHVNANGSSSNGASVSTPGSADSGVSTLNGVAETTKEKAAVVDSAAMETGITVPASSTTNETSFTTKALQSELKQTDSLVPRCTDCESTNPTQADEGAVGQRQQQPAEEDDSMPPNLGTPHRDELPAPPPAAAALLLEEVHSSHNRHRPANVRQWTVGQVCEWLCEQGNYRREADIFRAQDIDGASLMLLKNMNELTSSGIKLGPAVKILERVRRLQTAMECGQV